MTSWPTLHAALQSHPSAHVRVAKTDIPHPLAAGFRRSLGLPRGQVGDYRLRLPDCTCLHVWDRGTHWEAHLDGKDPSCSLLGHLAHDAPEVLVGLLAAGLVAGGAAIGGSTHGDKGAVVGGLVGAAAAALVVAISRPSAQPASR